MKIEIKEQKLVSFSDYAKVSIAFEVATVFDVVEQHQNPGAFTLTERRLNHPYVKDYDSIDGAQPQLWTQRYNTSNWGMFTAFADERLVGGAVVAFRSPGLNLLEGRDDLAVLWDIRVVPEARRHGVGSALFRAVEAWAQAKGCRELKVETQNVNVPACRFYERQGCVLTSVERHAYPEIPDEIQLLWRKTLFASASAKANYSPAAPRDLVIHNQGGK
jgi:GNAT superfamily N-acetyltransferase